MTVSDHDRRLVERLFAAMQAGPAGEDDMVALFTDDAVFVEPFSGDVRTHEGKDAIRAAFQGMFEEPAPDTELLLDRVDLDGEVVRAEWTCTSPVFPAPMRGHDLFTVRDGSIARLEVVVESMPGPPPGAPS